MIVDKQLKFTPTYLNLYGESVWNIWRKKKEKEKKSHRIVLKKKFSNKFFYSSIFIKLGLKKKNVYVQNSHIYLLSLIVYSYSQNRSPQLGPTMSGCRVPHRPTHTCHKVEFQSVTSRIGKPCKKRKAKITSIFPRFCI